MPRGGRNTKDEIVTVAMRLFVEQGYDRTTLREIADELDVTKAALYYHFRTKEDIVHAAMDAHTARLDAIIEWLSATPADRARDEALVERLVDAFSGPSSTAMQFTQSNPTVLSRKEFGDSSLDQTTRLLRAISGEHPSSETAIRALGAFATLVVGVLAPGGQGVLVPGSPKERQAAARTVALELLATMRSAA